MPIFELKCEDCKEQFETLAKKDELIVCPKCHSKNTKKLLSSFGFSCGTVFKSSVTSNDCGGCSSTACTPT
jgi:putative FmdB family regulatory protein